MPATSDYLALITPQHAGASRFVATVAASVAGFADLQTALAGLVAAFDLDDAVGVQLDAIGVRVGRSRYVETPLSGVYFSLDTAGLGLDQGSWLGPFDPTQGLSSLDDESYRLLLRAKSGANSWDGTGAQAAQIAEGMFPDGATTVLYIDRQDMTMDVVLAGALPPAVIQALFRGNYIPLRPSGVLANYWRPSASSAPVFGLDVNNTLVGGLDAGAWAIPL